jgi:hypothetical protein
LRFTVEVVGYSPSCPKVDDHLSSTRLWCSDELTNYHINGPESQPVSTIYERGSSLELVDKVSEEVQLIGIIKPFDTPLGHNAAAVCLRVLLVAW